MATPEQVPSDLTLELGSRLTPDRFLGATRAFFGFVEEISRAVCGDALAPHWLVQVREGSNLIGVEPAGDYPIAAVLAVYERVRSSVNQLSAGELDSDLTEQALKHIGALSDLTQTTRKARSDVRLWVERKPLPLHPQIGDVIREDARAGYKDYGTIEGRLEAIQDHGGLELRVRDAAFRMTVRCLLAEDMLPRAFHFFRKRVEVSGLIHYRRTGTPVSIDVTVIDPLPEDADLPGLEDVRGILRGAA